MRRMGRRGASTRVMCEVILGVIANQYARKLVPVLVRIVKKHETELLMEMD